MKGTAQAAGRFIILSLPLVFLAFWAGLLLLLGRTLSQLVPAALALDPAVLLLWLTLGPMTLHLAQAPFYRPRKPSGPAVFLRARLFESPLVFLPFTGPGHLETGPAFFAAAGPDDQARLLAAAEARLKHGRRAERLSLLLADRSPLDLALRAMSRWPWPLSLPAKLLKLLTSPTRQLARLWGFLFFMACKESWAAPEPTDDLTIRKRRLAWDLWQRARILAPPAMDEDEAALIRRLLRLRDRLYQKPGREADAGEAETPIWLAPRYRGAFADLPATLYAPDPGHLYASGRPETDLGLFYPPELALETEDAALLAAERAFLDDLKAEQAEEDLSWLDGRLRPAWLLAAELNNIKVQYERVMKRVFTHHARCRAAHLAAAEALGPGWADALRAWGALLWLAENGGQALTQAREDLAEPSLSQAELRDRALTNLLEIEDQVARGQAGPAPAAPRLPAANAAEFPAPAAGPQSPGAHYPRFKVGPASSAISALALALLIWQGWNQGLSQVTVYNGLPVAVTLTANRQNLTVPPFGHRPLRLRPGQEYEFTAALEGRTLEKFRQRLAPRPATEIYNVAGAAPLMEWWFPRAEQPGGGFELFLGRPRWLVTRATVLFEAPSGDHRALVLSGYGDVAPAEMLAPFQDPAERSELARLHARFLPAADPRFLAWLAFLPAEERLALIKERLSPNQAATAEADAVSPPNAPDLLKRVETWAEESPDLLEWE